MIHQHAKVERHCVVAVVARQDRLLAIRRSAQVIAPGRICFPGGGIENGESEEAALIRELHEELNLKIRPVRRLWQSVTRWKHALSWWLSDIVDDSEPQANPAEVAEILWLTPEEMLTTGNILDGNEEFLIALRRGEIKLVR